MVSDVFIQSADSAARLALSSIDGDYFTATFESPHLRVSKRVWGYTDCQFLADLFRSLAQDWKGWEGERTWESIEGEFGVSASSDRLGHIRLKLRFREVEGREPWMAEPALNVEAGQLNAIADAVQRFFTA
jgi:hypothetical protein